MKNWNDRQDKKKQDSQKSIRRAQLKRDLLDWLAIQPDRMALARRFRQED